MDGPSHGQSCGLLAKLVSHSVAVVIGICPQRACVTKDAVAAIVTVNLAVKGEDTRSR